MKVKRYIVWSANPEKLNLSDSWTKKWWLKQILTHGRKEDIKELNLKEVEVYMKKLDLPSDFASLWRDYFTWRKSNRNESETYPGRDS